MSDTRPDPAVGEARPDRGAGVDWRLYLVTDPHLGGGRDAVPGIAYEAVLGGVGVVGGARLNELPGALALDHRGQRAVDLRRFQPRRGIGADVSLAVGPGGKTRAAPCSP